MTGADVFLAFPEVVLRVIKKIYLLPLPATADKMPLASNDCPDVRTFS